MLEVKFAWKFGKFVKPPLSVPIYGRSFWYWWAHTEALMGSDMVVFFDPAIDCGLGLAGGLEPVGV